MSKLKHRDPNHGSPAKYHRGASLRRFLGSFSDVSLYEALRMLDDLLLHLEEQAGQRNKPAKGKTFAEVAEEWMKVKCIPNTEKQNVKRQQRRLDHYVLPASQANRSGRA